MNDEITVTLTPFQLEYLSMLMESRLNDRKQRLFKREHVLIEGLMAYFSDKITWKELLTIDIADLMLLRKDY